MALARANKITSSLSLSSLGLLAVIGAAARPAHADAELQAIAGEIETLRVKLAGSQRDFERDAGAPGQRTFSQRVADAEVLFLLGDYQRASLILFDLVNDPRNAREPNYLRAVQYLAEAQLQMDNLLAAHSLFAKLADSKESAYLEEAVRRLIAIADRTERWEGLNEQVALLEQRGTLPPSIAYIQAKSLVRQRRYDEVAGVADAIPPLHPLRPKARYMVGVARVEQGNLEDAIAVFSELMQTPDKFDDAVAIRELAAMNRGRILMEQGKVSEAIDTYQHVPRNSVYFEEALFEVTWLYIKSAETTETLAQREAEYGKALNALDIMLLGGGDGPLTPEARLLFGNILLRLARFDKASAAFLEVVERYRPLRAELEQMRTSIGDPGAYYDEVVSRAQGGGGVLPTVVVKWAAEQQRLAKALAVVKDLDQADTWINDTRTMLDKLSAVVESANRSRLFPTLQDAAAEQLAMQNHALQVGDKLVKVERRLLAAHLTPQEQAALVELDRQRSELEPAYQKLPQSRKQYEARVTLMRRAMAEKQQGVFRLGWEAEELRRGLDAVDKLLAGGAAELTAKQRREATDIIAQLRREVTVVRELQSALESEIERDRATIDVATEQDSQEVQLRSNYAQLVEQERGLLAAAAGRSEPQTGQALIRLREQLAQLHENIDVFGQGLKRIVDREAGALQQQLQQERELLDAHLKEVTEAREGARRVVGEVAVLSLTEVSQRFHDIVLRGDVGVVDVAWALKEEQTEKINRRLKQQSGALRRLDAEFKDILEE